MLEACSERYLALLATLEGRCAAPPAGDGGTSLEGARKEFDRLRKAMDELNRPSDEALHRARIKGKRARYAAELLEPDREARPGSSSSEEFQDAAGEHQDAVVAEERIRELVDRLKASVALAAGILIGRQSGAPP